jgi:hypothetical protein
MRHLAVVATLALGTLAGCGWLPGCAPYDPEAAKATFDGRVGTVEIVNEGTTDVRVELYHPDGTGGVEDSTVVPAGMSVALPGGIGNDWGIGIGDGCVTTLGEAASWSAAEARFVITWPDD